PGHVRFLAEFPEMLELAEHLRAHPVSGVPVYMPVNSEPDGEAYAAGLLGMLGIPLLPVPDWPDSGNLLLLTSHAAGDPESAARTLAWIERGGSVVMTHRFLARADSDGALAA